MRPEISPLYIRPSLTHSLTRSSDPLLISSSPADQRTSATRPSSLIIAVLLFALLVAGAHALCGDGIREAPGEGSWESTPLLTVDTAKPFVSTH